jgi:hypothetical protein
MASMPREPIETKAEKLQRLKLERIKNLQEIYLLREQQKF